MQLCIDIGNTRVKTGVFDNSELLFVERRQDFELPFHQNLLDKFAINNIIISSTRAEEPGLEAFLKTGWQRRWPVLPCFREKTLFLLMPGPASPPMLSTARVFF